MQSADIFIRKIKISAQLIVVFTFAAAFSMMRLDFFISVMP